MKIQREKRSSLYGLARMAGFGIICMASIPLYAGQFPDLKRTISQVDQPAVTLAIEPDTNQEYQCRLTCGQRISASSMPDDEEFAVVADQSNGCDITWGLQVGQSKDGKRTANLFRGSHYVGHFNLIEAQRFNKSVDDVLMVQCTMVKVEYPHGALETLRSALKSLWQAHQMKELRSDAIATAQEDGLDPKVIHPLLNAEPITQAGVTRAE